MLNEVINVDLHIHSKASSYKDGNIVSESDIEHLDVLFSKLEENGINLFSITDHNRFDYSLYEAILQWIAAHPESCVRAVLPGVEFDVRFEEGKTPCHVIAIFNVVDWAEDGPTIESAITSNLLEDKEASYSLEEFESLLKNINLNYMLIAHQHEGLSINPKKKRSLSNSTSAAKELLLFGYIDALEYNNSRVQGILLNELYELEIPSTAIVGSDCHTWECYPAHDSNQKPKSPFFTRIKCLPTFQGLLLAFTSPGTRFQVSNPTSKKEYLTGFMYGEKVSVPFSPGINAIIGENGSGKSSILSLLKNADPKEKWIKAYKKEYSIVTESLPSQDRTISIQQGDLRNNYDNGALFESSLFNPIDNNEFETSVSSFSDSLKSAILDSVKRKDHLDQLKQVSFRIDSQLEGSTFNINVISDESFTEIENEPAARYTALSRIRKSIQAEIDSGYYEEPQVAGLEKAKTAIDEVSQIVLRSKNEIEAEVAVRNIIHLAIEEYSAKCSKHTTEIDARRREYRKGKKSFIDSICNVIEDQTRDQVFPTELTCSKNQGISTNTKNGFKFQTTAQYAKESDLSISLLKKIFNKGFHSLDDVCRIDSLDKLSEAITGSNEIPWEERWKTAVEKYVSEMEKSEPSIHDQRSKGRIGNTFGEQSLTYYKYKSFNSNDWDVLIIDQPEDDISHSRINSELIEYLNNLRSTHQIIMVTHNPLLVVNLDVDNVIVLEKQAGQLEIMSGCLESPGILDRVAEHMDGGKTAIQRRVKAYDAHFEN